MSKEKEEVEVDTDRSFSTWYVLAVALCMFSLGAIVKGGFHQCKPEPEAPHYENHKMGDENIIKFFYEGQVYYNTWRPRGLWSDVNGDTVARHSDWRTDQDDLNCGLDKILRRDKALRLVEAAGLASVGIMKFATIVFIPVAAIPLIISGVLFLALGAAVWRWIERPRVALAAAALGLLALVSGIPFIAEDLSHVDSWGSFAPAAVSIVVGLAGIAAGFISFFAPGMQGSRPFASAAGALSIVLVVASVGASVSASK